MAAVSDPVAMGSDQKLPSSPPLSAPGAFPGANGSEADQDEEEIAPRPPPHRTPSSSVPKADTEAEAETHKAAGNKFFKAQQFDKAIAEYTKGISLSLHNLFLFRV